MRFVVMFLCALTILAGERVSADSSLFAPYTPLDYPDLVSDGGDVVYNAGVDTLSIQAFAQQISFSFGVIESITQLGDPNAPGSFSLNAMISSGADLTGQSISGSLTISGETASYLGMGDLLTGNLFAFRSTALDQMEFLYKVTGGKLSALYGGLDAVGFVVLGGTGFTGAGGFDNDFDNLNGGGAGSGSANANTLAAAVPEPGSFLLAAFGIFGLAGGAHLRRKRQQSKDVV